MKMKGRRGRRGGGGGGGTIYRSIYLRNFLIFDSDGCILPAKRTPLKIPGLKRINDVIYKIRYGCFSHSFPAKSLIRSEFKPFVI